MKEIMHSNALDHYLALEYPCNVHAEQEGGYTAVFSDLPGCMTQGETLEEVVPMAEDARRGWIETEYERGNDIPLPSYTEEYSGKFNVRIPKSLHRSLAEAAAREGIPLSQLLEKALQAYLGPAKGNRTRRYPWSAQLVPPCAACPLRTLTQQSQLDGDPV